MSSAANRSTVKKRTRQGNRGRFLEQRDTEPIRSSTTFWSSTRSMEGFKKGGLENMPSKCAKLSLQTSKRSTSCSAMLPWNPLIKPPKIPEEAPCDHRNYLHNTIKFWAKNRKPEIELQPVLSSDWEIN